MKDAKNICYLAVLTALYVVMSAFLKFTLIGNIQIDFGYIAFAVSICLFGTYGATVGVIGCILESLLFSAYGISVGWAVANAIIEIICGIAFAHTNHFGIQVIATIVSCFLGLFVAKTLIECALYSIPLVVKIPKSAVAFAADAAVMIAGLCVYQALEKTPIVKKIKGAR